MIIARTPPIEGADTVVEWFGRWPSFHDAEVLDVLLRRRGRSAVQIHFWQTTGETDAQGYFVRDRHAVVTFWLEGILDLELADFSAQNVISSLAIESVANGFHMVLSPCYGLAGYIDAERVSVTIAPGKPDCNA